jgi:hypothetical protein
VSWSIALFPRATICSKLLTGSAAYATWTNAASTTAANRCTQHVSHALGKIFMVALLQQVDLSL